MRWCTACCGWYDPRKDKDKGEKCTRCKEVDRNDVDWSRIPMTDADGGYNFRIHKPRRSTKNAHREAQVRRLIKRQFRTCIVNLNAMLKTALMKRCGSQAVACVLGATKLRQEILQIVHALLCAEQSRKGTFVWWCSESWEPLCWP